ncbi:Protein hgh1 [Sparganum proliferum]
MLRMAMTSLQTSARPQMEQTKLAVVAKVARDSVLLHLEEANSPTQVTRRTEQNLKLTNTLKFAVVLEAVMEAVDPFRSSLVDLVQNHQLIPHSAAQTRLPWHAPSYDYGDYYASDSCGGTQKQSGNRSYNSQSNVVAKLRPPPETGIKQLRQQTDSFGGGASGLPQGSRPTVSPYRQMTQFVAEVQMASDNAGVLEALLNVSSDERSIHGMSEELNLYYDTLVGVLIETTKSASANKLNNEGCADDPSKRTSVVGIIKNCCFEDKFHPDLCSAADNLFSKLLLRLCGPEDKLSLEDIQSLSPVLRPVYGTEKAFREPDSIIKKTVCEALLQLCSTPVGRSHLRSLGAYFVLRELHNFECMREKRLLSEVEDGFGNSRTLQSQRNLIFIIEQVVDQLICLENERPTEFRSTSLRNIPVNEKIQRNLEAAKGEFVSG